MAEVEIPQGLEQYGEELRKGLAAVERRQNERAFQAQRPQPEQTHLPLFETTEEVEEQPQAERPRHVKIWPLMAIAAWRNKAGGAWRLWILAKMLDQAGSGFVMLDDLQFTAARLGVHPKSFDRWLKQALHLGLVRSVWGGAKLLIASHEKGAYVLGCEHIGPRRAVLSLELLFGDGWRSYVWAAYLATHNGRPITRQKLYELTGVPKSTQRAYEKAANFSGTPNYMITDSEVFFLAEWVEHKPHAFSFYDKPRQARFVAWRGPNSYDTLGVAESASRGRSKKVNQALNRLRGSSLWGRAAGEESEAFIRLFNDSHNQAKATLKRIVKLDVPFWKVSEIFERQHKGSKADFWHVLDTSTPLPC